MSARRRIFSIDQISEDQSGFWLARSSSGQSPRLRARDSRLWILLERKGKERNLETAVRICSGLPFSFLLYLRPRIYYLFLHAAKLFKVLDKERRQPLCSRVVLVLV